MKKSLGVNALLNGIRTMLNLLFPLITFPYVARTLGVDNVGKYDFALSVNQYLLLIAALGINTYAVREGAKYRDDPARISTFASQVFTINLFSTIFAYCVMVVGLLTVRKFDDYRLLLVVFSIELIFTTIGMEWVYTIFEEYTYITVRSIIFKVLSIVLLLTLVKKPDDYVVYAGITVFANAGSNILNYIHLKKICKVRVIKNTEWKLHLKPILVIFASTIATSIYVNSDITMLGFLATDYEVGIYSVSAKIYRIVKQMLAAVLVVSIPRLAMLMGQKREEEYRKLFTKIFNVLTALVFPAVVGLFMTSREIVLLIAGKEYINAVSSLRLLSVALAVCIFGWLFNQCVMMPAKKEKTVLIVTITSALVNIAINFFLIPFLKENAAAISTIVAEGIMLVVCVYHGLKITRLDRSVIYNALSVFVGCGVICLTCTGIRQLGLSAVITLVLCIAASCITYGISLLLFRNKIIMEGLGKAKKLLKR